MTFTCYGTDFATTASVLYFFISGAELQHSAVAGSHLPLLCRRWQPTTLYSAVAGSEPPFTLLKLALLSKVLSFS